MRIVIAAALAVALSGCGPIYSPQELAAVATAKQVNTQLAREHKITWTEAANREVATALQIAGDRATADEKALYSMKIAMAVEVDAGRMTPEMADFRYNEGLAQIEAKQQAADEARQRAIGAALIAAGDGMQAYGDAIRPPPRFQTSCTSNQLGQFVYTNCN